MTILSTNLRRLREHRNFSKEFIARYCKASQPAVTQWENEAQSYVPKLDKLISLAGLYKTTLDEMCRNPNLVPGEVVSPVLDNVTLEKFFRTMDNSKIISYAFNQASVKRRAYLFILLYSLCEEIESNYLDETEVTALMDIKNEPKKRKTAQSSRKRATARTRSTTSKKH